ncbi:MAG: Hsp70 family protein [Candidatus Brocadiae bacterium]|nr:Hsp70 family protein [Candidatus Brocadiia bacterium]
MQKHLIGIDLGTANSALAFRDAKTDKTTIQTLQFRPEYQVSGREGQTPILPSLVTFCVDGAQWVGNDARSKYINAVDDRGDILIGDVKNWIGDRGKHYSIPGNKKVTPIDVSTIILQKMRDKFTAKHGYLPSEAVICIPASFDPAYREATIEAAKNAGITEVNLLDEPRAVIYYLEYQLTQDAISNFFNDFGKESLNCMVYDFGGGTVDVSFHEVSRKQNLPLSINDYGISCYKQLGGNSFDKALLKWILNQHNIIEDKIPEHKRFALQAVCEEFKISLSGKGSEILNPLSQLWENIEKKWELLEKIDDVPDINFTQYGYNIVQKMNSKQYINIMNDLMAWEDTETTENPRISIVEPIIDVLKKAQQANGGKFIWPDIVFLNGQMCNFFLVLRRLRKFFPSNIRIISSLKEDWIDYGTAVAIGAVQYASFLKSQYTLLQRQTIRTSECYALQIQDRGEICWYSLCDKGDVLYKEGKEGEIDDLELPPKSHGMKILVYSAEDKQKLDEGNGKAIIYKEFELNTIYKNYEKITPVKVQWKISRERIITLKIINRDTSEEIATLTSTNSQDTSIDFNVSMISPSKGIVTNSTKSEQNEKIQFLQNWHRRVPFKPQGEHVPPEKIDKIIDLFKIDKSDFNKMEHESSKIEQEIIKSENGADLAEIIIKEFKKILQDLKKKLPISMNNTCYLFRRFLLLTGGIYPALYHSNDKKNIKIINTLFQESSKFIKDNYLGKTIFINQILQMIIQGWSRMGKDAEGAEEFIKELIQTPNLPPSLYYSSLVPLAKVARGKEFENSKIFDFLAIGLISPIKYSLEIKLPKEHSSNWRENIAWCVGSLAYRKEDIIYSKEKLEDIKLELYRRSQVEEFPKVLQNLLFAISGIFYQPETQNDPIFPATEEEQKKFETLLARIRDKDKSNLLQKYIDLAEYSIKGGKIAELKDELFHLLRRELEKEENS